MRREVNRADSAFQLANEGKNDDRFLSHVISSGELRNTQNDVIKRLKVPNLEFKTPRAKLTTIPYTKSAKIDWS